MKIATRRAWCHAWNRFGPFLPLATVVVVIIVGTVFASIVLR